jgi:basic membrane lipoprotein Med (substrate-binding protein (PBP1-ABC) superfamily)
MNRTLAVGALAGSCALVFLRVSCSRQEGMPTASEASRPGAKARRGGESTGSEPSAFKVGLLVPAPVSDGGWCQIAYEGLQRIEKQLGAEVAYQQTERAEEFEEGFRGYARRGFQLVFGHGEEFSDAAGRVAPEFPQTIFVTTCGRTEGPNLAPLQFAMEEGTYLLGMLAAGVSRTGKAGQIGGMALPQIQRAFDAFVAGARSVNPRFEVTTQYVGSWTNANTAKEMALARIREGADVLFPNADSAGLGVFQAAVENRSRGVYAVGVNANQNELAPEVILASAVFDVPKAFTQMATQVREGRFFGRRHEFGTKDGLVALVINPRLEERIPAAVRRRVRQAEDALRRGTSLARLDPSLAPPG